MLQNRIWPDPTSNGKITMRSPNAIIVSLNTNNLGQLFRPPLNDIASKKTQLTTGYTFEPRLSGFLDYPSFFSSPNFVTSIHCSWSRSVARFLLKPQNWKVQWKASLFCFQRAWTALARVVTNEECLNEFWLAQSRIVAKWNFTL